MNPGLGLIGLARKGGRIEMGEEPCGSACRAGRAAAVFTACDAADNSLRRASGFAKLAQIPHFTLNFTKEDLGAACGRNSLAMFAVCDFGLALTIAQRLCLCDECELDFLKQAVALTAKKNKARKKK